jgi:hypothetical protein
LVRADRTARVGANVSALAAQDMVKALRESEQRQAADFKASVAVAQKSAEAAELNARAAVGVEVPHLWILGVDAIGRVKGKTAWLERFQVQVRIKNFGRTPAFVHTIDMGHDIDSDLPDSPEYLTSLGPEETIIIEGGEIHVHEEGFISKFPGFRAEEVARMGTTGHGIMLCGVIKFRDFLGADHSKGFICSWMNFEHMGGEARFVDVGNIYSTYDYQT